MVGWMAVSLAGHDKNKLYMIMEETDASVMLSDGKLRPLNKMKCKKKKHIQVIKKTMDEDLSNRIRLKEACRDEEIKRALKLYQQNLEKIQE